MKKAMKSLGIMLKKLQIKPKISVNNVERQLHIRRDKLERKKINHFDEMTRKSEKSEGKFVTQIT